jgi:hypothetical protein
LSASHPLSVGSHPVHFYSTLATMADNSRFGIFTT